MEKIPVKNKTYSTSFTVYPDHCNYLKVNGEPMVHGGTMLLRMDRAAAVCVRRALHDSPCDSALTVGLNDVKFLFGAQLGDLIFLNCEIVKVGLKSITVDITCEVEYEDGSRRKMATGIIHFCSTKDGKTHNHQLVL